ncbi:MAG: ATP synthase F1 subunit delta [Chloroflexota bacterium]|nr:ATP synthase F1 subunit delta [Chloroflexota bacterium]
MAARAISAQRYAEAVLGLAEDADAMASWSRDLRTIADLVSEPDIMGIVRSGKVPRPEKLRLLEAGLEAQISPLAMNLVRVLIERNKLPLAGDIQTAFQEMVDQQRGVAHATVTTAVALSDDERNAIAAKLSNMTGKQVDVTPVVDDSIIAGVIARIGDQLIDGSTRTRLVALKRRLEGVAS